MLELMRLAGTARRLLRDGRTAGMDESGRGISSAGRGSYARATTWRRYKRVRPHFQCAIPILGSGPRREGVSQYPCGWDRLVSRQHFHCAMKVKLFMTIFELDQTEEEILAHQISDEALEIAAGSKTAANYTLFFCTALDLCPGP